MENQLTMSKKIENYLPGRNLKFIRKMENNFPKLIFAPNHLSETICTNYIYIRLEFANDELLWNEGRVEYVKKSYKNAISVFQALMEQNDDIVAIFNMGEDNMNEPFHKLYTELITKKDYLTLILARIHNEHSFEPQLSQKIVFYFPKQNIGYYIYDHRGGILWSNSVQNLQKYYMQFEWMLNPWWKERVDAMFKESLDS